MTSLRARIACVLTGGHRWQVAGLLRQGLAVGSAHCVRCGHRS